MSHGSCMAEPWGLHLEPYKLRLTGKRADRDFPDEITIDTFLIHEILSALVDSGDEVCDETLAGSQDEERQGYPWFYLSTNR